MTPSPALGCRPWLRLGPKSGPGQGTPLGFDGSRAWNVRQRCGVRNEVPLWGGRWVAV